MSKMPSKNKKSYQNKAKSRPKDPNLPTKTAIVQIEGLSHEGRGIARYQGNDLTQHGKKIFVRFALPNEQVEIKINKINKRFDEAEMVRLISSSAKERIQPICEYFGQCGGCALQHIDSQTQLQIKQNALLSHLTHFADLNDELNYIEWLKPLSVKTQNYRRRARLGIRNIKNKQGNNQLIMGFRALQSNYLIHIQHCPILTKEINQHLPALQSCLNQFNALEVITHLEFSQASNAIALSIRHIQKLNQHDLQRLTQFCAERQWQLFLQSEKKQQAQCVYQADGQDDLYYDLTDYQVKVYFQPDDFIQVNAEINQKMIKQACDLLDLKHGETVLDLFCGLGNFSFALAKCIGETGRVFAVEGVASMVERAKINAKRNHIENIEFFHEDLTQDFSKSVWATQGVDAILLDPPRAGADFVMQSIVRLQAKRIVYISCDPATLARDIKTLQNQGYQLQKIGVMDMFPHTEHIESIALFSRVYEHENNTDINVCKSHLE